ncbi:uncharacterized protein LOC128373942 [Scomber japonicus]|uniref:uncharacterized protein LOC128373942 n=1 Tax=Scomber japonicus TaxID=13676 RepID=UPI002306444C|nr:uncharacterized protein LOC128373942 [Scomber japonicus]
MVNNRRGEQEDFLKSQEPFRHNAFKIITKMLDWCNMTEGSKKFVDEILHSIFFLGKINKPQFLPEMIFADDKQILENLKERYPKPFELYSTQLPRRSPFSCVLDMIVLQKGQKNENQILQSLRDLLNELKSRFLVSSTICVSQKSNIPNSDRYLHVHFWTESRTDEKAEWAYGNCAEAESVSNLLKNEKDVKENAQPTCTDENRQKAKERVDICINLRSH